MSTLRDALDRVGQQGDHLDVTAAKPLDGPAELRVEGFKDVGRPGGWTVGGGWQWVKDQGHALVGKLSWRPRD